MVLEFVKSQRGKPKLKHEGYLYCLLLEKDGLKTWRCEKRQCKAIATTFEENVFTTREHLHEPDMKHSEQLKVLEKMKENAANSKEKPRKIVQDTTATNTSECAVALPKYKSLARSIQRQRGWGNNPTILKDVAIPSELQLTLRGEKFLAYDSGSDDRERFLIFSTEQNLDLLESTPQWHADGTFKCLYLIKEGEFEDSEYCTTFASVKGLISPFPRSTPITWGHGASLFLKFTLIT